jgi:anti-anti-sigma factor
MEFSSREMHGCKILSMVGDLDLYSSPGACGELIANIQTAQGKKIVVDLSEVSYIDSSGIGVLIAAFSQARKLGVGLRFANPTAEVQRVVRLTSLNGFLPIEETVSEAIKSLFVKGR